AIAIRPDYAHAWSNKGLALAAIGEYEEAVLAYDEVVRIRPEDGEAWKNRGGALQALGRASEAEASFEMGRKLGALSTAGGEEA
ncbi:MAG: tetratricopeptide repeat protein, partial [Methanothrix sp.]